MWVWLPQVINAEDLYQYDLGCWTGHKTPTLIYDFPVISQYAVFWMWRNATSQLRLLHCQPLALVSNYQLANNYQLHKQMPSFKTLLLEVVSLLLISGYREKQVHTGEPFFNGFQSPVFASDYQLGKQLSNTSNDCKLIKYRFPLMSLVVILECPEM